MTIQGMSFYDFIGKLIPGTMIWAPLLTSELFSDFSLLETITCFTLMFLTGLLWDAFMRLIFSWLRLNRTMLKNSYRNTIKRIGDVKASSDTGIDPKDDIRTKYLKSYTNLEFHSMLGNIPWIEAQENFLRNIWLILLYLIIMDFGEEYFSYGCKNIIQIVLIITYSLIPILWYFMQMKIYNLVWETELYIPSEKNAKLNP